MRIALAFAATLALTACDNKVLPQESAAPPAAEVAPPAGPAQGIAEELDLATATIPPPVAAGEDLLAGLAKGGSATLRLDCPSGAEAAQYLGTLMCGGDYVVYYEPSTLRWVAIGPNRSLADSGAADPKTGAKNPGPPPTEGTIVVWGAPFKIDAESKAALGSGLVVGKLIATGQ